MKRIGMGLVGPGFVGAHHIDAVRRLGFVDVVAVARRKAERAKAEQRAKDALAEIDSIGVQVKDIDIGLLDFPCEVDGRVVLLCWKMGEASITHWHGTDEGFAGRKLIDERIARPKRTN